MMTEAIIFPKEGSYIEVPEDIEGPLIRLILSKDVVLDHLDAVLRDPTTNIHAQDLEGRTALMIAAEAGFSQVVQVLAQHGARLNDQDLEERTALMLAVRAGHLEVVKALLALPACDVNIQDNETNTALMDALIFHSLCKDEGSQSQMTDIIRALARNRSLDLSIVNQYGHAPYDLAKKSLSWPDDLKVFFTPSLSPDEIRANQLRHVGHIIHDPTVGQLVDNTGGFAFKILEGYLRAGVDINSSFTHTAAMGEVAYYPLLAMSIVLQNPNLLAQLFRYPGRALNPYVTHPETGCTPLLFTLSLGSSAHAFIQDEMLDRVIADVNVGDCAGETPLLVLVKQIYQPQSPINIIQLKDAPEGEAVEGELYLYLKTVLVENRTRIGSALMPIHRAYYAVLNPLDHLIINRVELTEANLGAQYAGVLAALLAKTKLTPEQDKAVCDLALAKGHVGQYIALIKALVARGADPTQANTAGETPISVVPVGSQIYRILTNVTQQTTPLLAAITAGDLHGLQILIRRGANVNEKVRGVSPFMCAIKKAYIYPDSRQGVEPYIQMIKELLAAGATLPEKALSLVPRGSEAARIFPLFAQPFYRAGSGAGSAEHAPVPNMRTPLLHPRDSRA